MTIGYVRVSTIEQAQEGVSLSAQTQKIKQYVGLKELQDLHIIQDKGASGKNLKRDGIKEIIDLCKSGKVDNIIIYKLDRLTRNIRDLLYLMEDVFVKNKVDFHSVTENIDTTTAQGEFYLNMLGALNQMVRRQISDNTKMALNELKRQGYRLGNPAKSPFGYRITKHKKVKVTDLKPVKEELRLIKKVFDLRGDNYSLSKISTIVNKPKSTIHFWLNNPVYTF